MKTFLFILLATTCIGSTVFAQTQKGLDIDGETAGDNSGRSVSMPDNNTVAIGAPFNDGNGSDAGHVKIHTWNGSAWTQKGVDIDGETAGDQSGYSVSMPDDNTVAIGARANGGNTGHVRIYNWNGSAWTQKGADIDGEAAGDRSGWSVSMPDANTVAVGAPSNAGNGSSAGHVRIYTWNGSAWTQKGVDIDGEAAFDQSGFSVSMPDANTVAIGAYGNDANGNNAGQVKIYNWNGSVWLQKGADINGEAADDWSGSSVSMPDANTLAVGASRNDGNGTRSGHVRIYTWNGSIWTQKGLDIDGEAPSDESGFSVSMPDANTVAIGANRNEGNGNSAGHVRLFSWNGSAWVQKGADIDGESAFDNSGWFVSMPDTNTVAIGAVNNAGNGSNSGHVRIYSFCTPSTGSDIQTECDSYTWIDGNTYTASNNTATFTLTNAAGCDSIVTLDLTINNSATGTDTRTECNSYTWIDGNTYTASNNSATFNIIGGAANGCDSIVTLDLTINNSATGTDTRTECNSYAWIDGNTYTASNSSATFNIVGGAANGCDSLVTLDLTINNSATGTDTRTECNSYTWIDGNTYTASNNSATFNIIGGAANGCDSIVTLDLTINNSATGTDTRTECNSYTWIDGNTYTASNNSATFNIIGGAANGCDSIVTLDLTINNSNTGTDVQTACDSYTWIDGNTYTASNNTATWTLTNAVGCDSIVTLDLTINNSNTGTDIQTACDSYTWIDGNTYTASNNTATWTLTNAAGCDSIVTLDLTINNSATGTDTRTECNSYTWIDGNTYTASNNTATFTLTNAAGCDSIVTLDLTINNSNTGTDVQTACDSYTWIDGNTYTASNNTATWTLTNAAGCDSIVTLDLTINNSNAGTDVQTACDSYTWIDGNTYTSSNNTATWTLTNAAGCDSIVTLDLTINNSNSGTDVQTACDSYTWIDGNTYTTSNNTATFTLTNAAGCDSIVTLDLTIETVDVSTTQNGTELSANLAGASAYQWVDCDNGNQPITGETNQILNVTANGIYAVVVTNGNCSDTSDCMLVDYIGIKEQILHDDLTLYPNPSADGLININFDGQIRSILVMDLSGREVNVSTHLEKKMILGSDLSPGRYIVRLETDSGSIIKELLIVR